ncbi:hypothetical protein PRIPAC_72475 [Pristionchus pacificus]|uniref:Uncharacterized protein n=1 Tax=Pristionchus pacificus TaxID=54126 RepID=A0A2A6B4W7_PRIPA|nr:hypothetical protein PRIPAC_72475 [Pristionchus pacificus]|eukprot:PDM60926.1 hypothetical protein PRIPAC_54732 [Pristionchus pacificus]
MIVRLFFVFVFISMCVVNSTPEKQTECENKCRFTFVTNQMVRNSTLNVRCMNSCLGIVPAGGQ